VTSKPNWITEEEIEFISEALIPYFTDRVNRYREIVNYREERREESHKRKTELDKKKERQRLVNIYKGE
jgi:DNA polymerase II small subunit/DNA polymerase delta subunit B